jgi:Flp pilus assembly protein protease CpaA
MVLIMVTELIILTIAALALIIGSYTDFKKREVPDWLSIGLIFIGFGIRFIFSIVYKEPSYIIAGLFGFGTFFLIAILMFYTGQWGGGDSKTLMGLGALIGLEFKIDSFLLGFAANAIIFGALFGLLFSVVLVCLNFKKFTAEFEKQFNEKRKQKYVVWAITAFLIITTLFAPYYLRFALLILAALTLISFYLFAYLKAVEHSCMIKAVSPEELTEGDWIVEDVIVNKKRICGPKDLGIEISQIKKLIKLKEKNKIDKILIKNGIPFVPSFLIAFIATYFWGNVVLELIGFI